MDLKSPILIPCTDSIKISDTKNSDKNGKLNNLSLRNKDTEYLQVFKIIKLLGLIIMLYHGE